MGAAGNKRARQTSQAPEVQHSNGSVSHILQACLHCSGTIVVHYFKLLQEIGEGKLRIEMDHNWLYMLAETIAEHRNL